MSLKDVLDGNVKAYVLVDGSNLALRRDAMSVYFAQDRARLAGGKAPSQFGIASDEVLRAADRYQAVTWLLFFDNQNVLKDSAHRDGSKGITTHVIATRDGRTADDAIVESVERLKNFNSPIVVVTEDYGLRRRLTDQFGDRVTYADHNELRKLR